MKYHLISAAALIGAVFFYMVNLGGAGAAFLACGVALEIVFWMRMVRARRGRREG